VTYDLESKSDFIKKFGRKFHKPGLAEKSVLVVPTTECIGVYKHLLRPISKIDNGPLTCKGVTCLVCFFFSWFFKVAWNWNITNRRWGKDKKGGEEKQIRNSIKFDSVEENVGIWSSWENAVPNILSVCLSVFVTREMVESLHVAMFSYGIRITRGIVWKNTSVFTFPPRLLGLASVQAIWQENILFCRIWRTSVRVLTLITYLKTHSSELMTSKPEKFMLNYTFFNCRPAGWRLGNRGLIPIRGRDLSCPWFLHRLQVSHGFISNAVGEIYAVLKRSGRDASH